MTRLRVHRFAPVVLLFVTAVVAVAGCAAAPTSAPARQAPVHAAVVARGSSTARPPSTSSARVTAVTTTRPRLADRCRGNRLAQLVVVSLDTQHVWLCHLGRTVRTFPITTGATIRGDRTPTGHFRIQGRNRNCVLTLDDGRQYDVKYWIPFDAPDFGFHDASWQRIPFGSPRYRSAGSHGCVHLPLAAIRFLYDWVEIGTRVTITAA